MPDLAEFGPGPIMLKGVLESFVKWSAWLC